MSDAIEEQPAGNYASHVPALVLGTQAIIEGLDITFESLESKDGDAWAWMLHHPNLDDVHVTFSLVDNTDTEVISFAATIRDTDGEVFIDKPGILITSPTLPFIRKCIEEYVYAVSRGDLG